MNDEIAIRPGTPADLDQVIAIASASNSAAHWQPSDYAKIFETKRALIVAEFQTLVVGFVVAHDIAGEWELENIAVTPAYRQNGVGKRLVLALIDEARTSNAISILLEVRESNFPARKLYERCGFQQYGRRPSYYVNPSEDAVLYRFLCRPESLKNC